MASWKITYKWRFQWSMDWFKGNFTGKHQIWWEIPWFPVNFPLNQSIETSSQVGWKISTTWNQPVVSCCGSNLRTPPKKTTDYRRPFVSSDCLSMCILVYIYSYSYIYTVYIYTQYIYIYSIYIYTLYIYISHFLILQMMGDTHICLVKDTVPQLWHSHPF